MRYAPSYYRFYLKKDGHTFTAEILECNNDSDAIEKAKDLLASTMTFRLMEVWQGTRKVGNVERDSMSDELLRNQHLTG